MSRRLILLALVISIAGCAEPAPSATPTPTPTPTPTVAPTPTPLPDTLAPTGRLITTSEKALTGRAQLNLLLPKGASVPQLIADGSRLYFAASELRPLTEGGASSGTSYALYLFDPADGKVHKVEGSKTPRDLGRPMSTASQVGSDPVGAPLWSILYAGGVCYRSNGGYTSTKPQTAYLYAYDRQLSVEGEKGERGRCLFSDFPLYPAPVEPWIATAAPTRLCPPDRAECASAEGVLSYLLAGPVDPRVATDALLEPGAVGLFTTAFTTPDGSVEIDTLRYFKRNGTSGEIRYAGVPLYGRTSSVVTGPDGLLYLIVRSYEAAANQWFLASINPADPRLLTPLTTPPTR